MSNELAIYNAHYGESHEAGLSAVFKAGADSVGSIEAAPVETAVSSTQDDVDARDKRISALQDELDTAGSQLASVRKEWESERTTMQNEITALNDKLTKMSAAQVAGKVEKQTIDKSDVGDATKIIGGSLTTDGAQTANGSGAA